MARYRSMRLGRRMPSGPALASQARWAWGAERVLGSAWGHLAAPRRLLYMPPRKCCESVKSAPRERAKLRVQHQPPGQWVTKNHHVRRPLRHPRSFPTQLKPRPVLHETVQSCAQAPSLPCSTAEIYASPTPIISVTPTISKHPDELGLEYVKTRNHTGPET